MIAKTLSLLGVVAALAVGNPVAGQEVFVYDPIAPPVVEVPPSVTYGPVYVQRPVVVGSAPVTVYRPVVPAPAVRVYSPVVPSWTVPASPVVVTRQPVVVRSRYYVPGQPVRNVLRAARPW